ncbi:hypothetical protein HU200_053143 [Digitaria exilis]|uniref:RING-type E3 ubiquitin transferase n=1 Tax=Digitaria exilis TaxID=1010633 RepID=A0A835E8L1_9POAL|nr:hypothetical protein HU200_053143 [Digitaria exilis]CAB3459771.1 unnamed protein product [Digitaria exilis]
MDMDSVECLSLPDAAMDVDDVDSHPHHAHHGSHLGLTLHPAHLPSAGAGRVFPKVNAGAGAAAVVAAAGAAGAAGGPPATSVHELLECPVCTNSMFPPIHQVGARASLRLVRFQMGLRADLGISAGKAGIFTEALNQIGPFFGGFAMRRIGDLLRNCQNGHTLCSTCKARVHNRCPTCRQELGDIRCLALEKVAESLELPCKYCSLGCPEIFPYYSKIKHEAQCSFRPYNCPYAGSECAVAGDIPFLVAHLRDDHKVDMHSGCTFNHRYVKSNPREVENATWMLTVFHCFGQYFCLHFEAFQLGMAPVYMAFLRFMGDENEARNYTYSLEVGGNGRKMVWEGTPRSIRDSHRKVRDSHDGLIIQRNMALFFSGGDRKELKLRVTGRIWKEQTNPDGACIPNLCS